MEAAYNLVQVLWKLKRKDEAVSFWKKYYSSTKAAAEKVQQASGSQWVKLISYFALIKASKAPGKVFKGILTHVNLPETFQIELLMLNGY